MLTAAQHPYSRFLGCDVSKNTVTIFDSASGCCQDIANHPADLAAFLAGYGAETLAICEPTGGHEAVLLAGLSAAGIDTHRADTLKVKAFIRSFGTRGKTDALDARALALYAEERAETLSLWGLPDAERQDMQQLVQRRRDLVAMHVAETNRAKAPSPKTPGAKALASSFAALRDAIERQIAAIEHQLIDLVKGSAIVTRTIKVMTSVPGIGKTTAIALCAMMPELGQISGKQAASLAGLAPHPRDSGSYNGYRRIHGGRRQIGTVIFMGALAAARTNGPLKDWYNSLLQRGKRKKVALTALMRKMIVILNARLRDDLKAQQS